MQNKKIVAINYLFLAGLLGLYIWSIIIFFYPFSSIKPTFLSYLFGTVIWGGIFSFFVFWSCIEKIKSNQSSTLNTANIILSGIFLGLVILWLCLLIYDSIFK